MRGQRNCLVRCLCLTIGRSLSGFRGSKLEQNSVERPGSCHCTGTGPEVPGKKESAQAQDNCECGFLEACRGCTVCTCLIHFRSINHVPRNRLARKGLKKTNRASGGIYKLMCLH
ncbi:hypothetical protein BDW66DRAFT_126842, partial [Aspergillus desertorum]